MFLLPSESTAHKFIVKVKFEAKSDYLKIDKGPSIVFTGYIFALQQ